MLPASDEERRAVIDYMRWQAADLTVEFVQKIYTESVLGHQHHVWDVHTDADRWVITNPTNLYSQVQFPNMDLAVTFHVGLCLRIPRTEKRKPTGTLIAPLAECYRLAGEATDALGQAANVGDFQAVGVRCREALLAFSTATQILIQWSGSGEAPKNADFKAWMDHVCAATMAGDTHKSRRQLFKSLLEGAWNFANWLTHAKSSTWFDAEAAVSTVELAMTLGASSVLRHIRGVPETCPACGSHEISPQRGERDDVPGIEWERPVCESCAWTGKPVPILEEIEAYDDEGPPPSHEEPFVLPKVPLRTLLKPGDKA